MNKNFYWESFVKLTHWGVAFFVLANLFVSEEGETLHEWFGYTAVVLVILRLVWGITFAKKEARLSSMIPTVPGIKQHLNELKNRKETHSGHNPMGSLAVWAIWICIIALGATGYLDTTDWGIDNDIIETHEVFANILNLLFFLHIAAIVVTSLVFKRNLVKSMLPKILADKIK